MDPSGARKKKEKKKAHVTLQVGRDSPPFPPFPKRPAHSDSTRLRRGPHGSRPLPPPRRRRPRRLPPAAAGAPPLPGRLPCSARGRAEVSDSGPHANPVRSVRVCGGGAGLLRESRSGGACAFADRIGGFRARARLRCS